jgi:tRNA-intron endonuclease
MSETKAVLRLTVGDSNIDITVEKGLDIILRHLPERPTSKVEVIEALYLLYTGLAVALDQQEKQYTFEELMKLYTKINPYAWVEFEVYLDLRKRGRIPVKGPKEHTFLLRRSRRIRQYTHYILVLEENRPISVSSIYSFVEEALKNNWQPLIAIVDRYGDITYYSVMPFHPQKLRREEAKHLEIPS